MIDIRRRDRREQAFRKTSHVWDKDKRNIDVRIGPKHYYCIECCDREKDGRYISLSIRKKKTYDSIEKEGKKTNQGSSWSSFPFQMRALLRPTTPSSSSYGTARLTNTTRSSTWGLCETRTPRWAYWKNLAALLLKDLRDIRCHIDLIILNVTVGGTIVVTWFS